jgi:hypothetical protein
MVCSRLILGLVVVAAGCGGRASATTGSVADGGVPAGQVVPLPMGYQAVVPCDPGYAHPSVCCEPAPYQSPECVEDSDEPFRPCGRWLTFPDARTCCSLENAKQCAAPAQTDTDGSTSGCSLPCGPAGFLPNDPLAFVNDYLGQGADAGMVNCADDASGICDACCYGMYAEMGNDFSLVACASPDFSQGGPPICSGGACLAGWQVPHGGQFDVCCGTNDAGASECFSRANGIAPPVQQ